MSNIEWTNATWNPLVGCTPVSPGCLNCYAATMAPRLAAMGQQQYVGLTVKKVTQAGPKKLATRQVFNGTVRTLPERLTEPLHWRAPRMVFVNSMSDLFHESVPFEFVDKVFAVMALCPQHTFQVLTKRPERMAKYLARPLHPTMGCAIREIVGTTALSVWAMGRTEEAVSRFDELGGALSNVWLGTSVEDQPRFDERVKHLKDCVAAVRFLSVEPMLGPIDMHDAFYRARLGPEDPYKRRNSLENWWIIVGGESGNNARPCNVGWVRSIVQQCKAADVPVFVKQLGSMVHCRNDHVSAWLDEVGMGLDYMDTSETRMQGDPVRVMLNSRKGGDPSEWPEDLRVREFPR